MQGATMRASADGGRRQTASSSEGGGQTSSSDDTSTPDEPAKTGQHGCCVLSGHDQSSKTMGQGFVALLSCGSLGAGAYITPT